MRRAWSCSSCIALLLCSLAGRGATASHVAYQQKDVIHRLAKAQITARPERRDVSICQNGFSLCPASLSGGCCQSGYSCATDSCYATTAGPSSACGQTGYYACAASVGGGCCPDGFICGAQDCTAPAGVTNTFSSCSAGYYLCPASYNYGCCPSSMGCGLSLCYSTNPTTDTFTQTITTTTGAETLTSTLTVITTITPSAPPGLTNSDPYILKMMPTAISKVPATVSSTTGSGSSGLPSGEIGGIVAGAVALLIVVVAAAVLIIRHLNRVTQAIEASRKESSSSRTKSHNNDMVEAGARLDRPGPDSDVMSVADPLITRPPTNNTNSVRSTPQPGGSHVRANSDYSASQQGFGFPSSGHSSDIILGPGSDSASRQSGAGYFDMTPHGQNMRSSVESQGTQFQQYSYQQHWRQHSDTSELSDTSVHQSAAAATATTAAAAPPTATVSPSIGSPLIPAELVADGAYLPELSAHGERSPASSYAMPQSPHSAQTHSRRRSDPPYGSGGGRGESAGLVSFSGAPPLDVVNESSEILLHGYYGPQDQQQSGQTHGGDSQGGPASPPAPDDSRMR